MEAQVSLKHLSSILILTFGNLVFADQGDTKKLEQSFSSGVGVLLGMGVGTAVSQTQNGVSDGNYFYNPPRRTIGTASDPHSFYKIPATNFFSTASNIKNHTGLAFMTGLLAQYVSNHGVTTGVRWVYGRSESRSTVEYPQGILGILSAGSPLPPNPPRPLRVSAQFEPNGSQSFLLKDSYFNAVLFELGYVLKASFLPKCLQKFQVYVAPGFSLHHQKFSPLDADGKVSGDSLSKSVPAPVFALGTRYAISKRMSFGFEWQRHMGNKKAWSQITQIMPANSTYGAPLMSMNNNLFMFSLTYMFMRR